VDPQATAGASELQQAQDRERATYLWIRALSVAIIVFVAANSFHARPAPGGHGQALAVTVTLIALCGVTITVMWLARAKPALHPAVQLGVPLLAVATAATLVGLQANNAGFLGVFPALGFAALVLPVPISAVVAGAAIVAVSAAWVATGRAPVQGIILNDFAIAAIYFLSLFARRLQESNQRAELMLAELEQTRAAQAQAAMLAERQHLTREMHDPCTFSVTGDESELGSDGRLTCYRVAQEALTNVRKHARADVVEMRLAYEPSGTRLTIQDSSARGEPPAPSDGTGYGLTGMRERAALLGGTLKAGPTNDGFRVELWMPA